VNRFTGGDEIARHVGRVEQATALLRLAAVGLFAAAEQLPPKSDATVPFFILLGAYFVWSVIILVLATRSRSTGPAALVVTGVDVAVISALCGLSGGPYSLVRLGYFFVPLTVSFRYRPSLTFAATVVVLVMFVAQPVLDLGPTQADEAGFIAVWAGFMAWIGIASTVLSAVVARRIQEVTQLSADRKRLLAEVMAAESRERQRLAEGLHDGAIQSLLAIRHDLEHVAVTAGESEALTRADEALLDVVRQMRSTIFEMHPHVLEAAGLAAAVKQVAELAARRAGFELTLELHELPHRPSIDRVLFSVFRELITNAAKHADARHVTVTLRALSDARMLIVADDGRGFDPAEVQDRVAEGHIGLRSQQVRLETVAGTLEIGRGEGGGTVATVRVPQ
jgi:two-component system, NarL family, sensor kinase